MCSAKSAEKKAIESKKEVSLAHEPTCDNFGQSENSLVVGQNSVQVGHLMSQRNDQPAAKVGHKVKKRCQWILDKLAKGLKLTEEYVQKEHIFSE